MNDPKSARRLAAAVLQCALKDSKGRKGADRVEALAWLASSRASLYFDLLEMPQSSLLTRSGWMGWAEEIITSDPGTETREQIVVILQTLEYLEELKESQTAIPTPEDV